MNQLHHNRQGCSTPGKESPKQTHVCQPTGRERLRPTCQAFEPILPETYLQIFKTWTLPTGYCMSDFKIHLKQVRVKCLKHNQNKKFGRPISCQQLKCPFLFS